MATLEAPAIEELSSLSGERGMATIMTVCNVEVPWSHRLGYFENNYADN